MGDLNIRNNKKQKGTYNSDELALMQSSEN